VFSQQRKITQWKTNGGRGEENVKKEQLERHDRTNGDLLAWVEGREQENSKERIRDFYLHIRMQIQIQQFQKILDLDPWPHLKKQILFAFVSL
jgi:hypothetical protein